MWLLNKLTGVKWEIVDTELLERLSKDKNFEEVKEEIEEKVVKKATKKK